MFTFCTAADAIGGGAVPVLLPLAAALVASVSATAFSGALFLSQPVAANTMATVANRVRARPEGFMLLVVARRTVSRNRDAPAHGG
jgi:hypothetical protein